MKDPQLYSLGLHMCGTSYKDTTSEQKQTIIVNYSNMYKLTKKLIMSLYLAVVASTSFPLPTPSHGVSRPPPYRSYSSASTPSDRRCLDRPVVHPDGPVGGSRTKTTHTTSTSQVGWGPVLGTWPHMVRARFGRVPGVRAERPFWEPINCRSGYLSPPRAPCLGLFHSPNKHVV